MTMNILFIGGQEDGKWHDIPDNDLFWRVPQRLELDVYISQCNEPYYAEFETYLYGKQTLVGRDGRKQFVMQLVNDEDDCIVRKLIKGYRQ